MKKINNTSQEVAFKTITDNRSDLQEFNLYLGGEFAYCRVDNPEEWGESEYYIWIVKREIFEGELLKIICLDIHPSKP